MTTEQQPISEESTLEQGMIDGYTITYESDATGVSAWSDDVPGCFAAGATRAEVEQLMREAIPLHLSDMRNPVSAS
jgi:predicted RNase H-like HicB family nuclease